MREKTAMRIIKEAKIKSFKKLNKGSIYGEKSKAAFDDILDIMVDYLKPIIDEAIDVKKIRKTK